ncbi:M48 family metalloprotease [Dokdonella sp.]|uniref:M48 family metalloprotease n=1 Tax=Dokdonella sp. TaxID=2291710 RepID=UPI0031C13A78|nr:M48 family metalloprotease [Dokdonella sp.]
MSITRALPVVVLACAATLAGARDPDVKLPDIGSSAAALATSQELRDYGAAMLHQLRAHELVLDDPLLDDYIKALGYRLVAASDRPDLGYTFFIMRSEDINAFAAPGGYVAVNAGLITAMQSEDELAGVMAHEISHVQQQHILRGFEDQQKMSIPIMLGMLGVMIASAGRGDDAAPAALVAGTSLMQQRQINFTRGEEAEADRVGIQILARAGFDPNAMAGAFQALQRVMRVNGVDVPEFLLTHPLDTRRIAESRARAAQLGCPGTPQLATRSAAPMASRGGTLDLSLPEQDSAAANSIRPPGSARADACAPRRDDKGYFDLMRERVRVLSAGSAPAIRGYYADNLRNDPSFDTPANRYGYALALLRTHQPQTAVEQLEPLATTRPDSVALRLALARARDRAGERKAALAAYEQLNLDFPGNRAVVLDYAEVLLTQGNEADARRALDLLRPQLDRHADDPDLQASFGRASQLAGDSVRAAEAYAEAAWLNGHAEDALSQLKALSRREDLSYYQRSRIDARITLLTATVLEQRKRGEQVERRDWQ